MNTTDKLAKLIDIAEDRSEDIETSLVISKLLDLPVMKYKFIVNEEKEMVICDGTDIDAKHVKKIKKAQDGDKFDAYTGVCVFLFEQLTSLGYSEVASIIEKIAPITLENDPVINFMKLYVKDRIGYTEDEFKKALAEANIEKGGGKVVVCNII